MTLDVVVPTLGRRAVLDDCLAHLAAQEDRDFRVLLVADAAALDLEGLRARFAAARLDGEVLQAPRPGASAARNTGWRAGRGGVVLFLDDDILADPTLVGAHRAVHAARPEVGVGALGRLRWADGLAVTPFMTFVDRGLQFDHAALASLAGGSTGWWHLYTCNVSLKAEALRVGGGFDEAGFPFLYEDLDLGRRLEDRLGLELALPDGAGAQHAHVPVLDEWRRRMGVIGAAERRFVHRYPDIRPYFRERLGVARPCRGRGAALARYVSASVPWLGPRVHGAADRYYAWELAQPFLAAWEAAAGAEDPGPAPRPG